MDGYYYYSYYHSHYFLHILNEYLVRKHHSYPSREAVQHDVRAPTQKGFAPEPPARERFNQV